MNETIIWLDYQLRHQKLIKESVYQNVPKRSKQTVSCEFELSLSSSMSLDQMWTVNNYKTKSQFSIDSWLELNKSTFQRHHLFVITSSHLISSHFQVIFKSFYHQLVFSFLFFFFNIIFFISSLLTLILSHNQFSFTNHLAVVDEFLKSISCDLTMWTNFKLIIYQFINDLLFFNVFYYFILSS